MDVFHTDFRVFLDHSVMDHAVIVYIELGRENAEPGQHIIVQGHTFVRVIKNYKGNLILFSVAVWVFIPETDQQLFKFFRSCGKFIVCDSQGVHPVLVDPQIGCFQRAVRRYLGERVNMSVRGGHGVADTGVRFKAGHDIGAVFLDQVFQRQQDPLRAVFDLLVAAEVCPEHDLCIGAAV